MKKYIIEGLIPEEEFSRKFYIDGIAYVEKILKGTFKKALMINDDIKLILNHDYSKELDSTKKTLTLKADHEELRFSAIVKSDIPINKIKGISFGFIVYEQKVYNIKNKFKIRYLKAINLKEISLLTISKGCYKAKITNIREVI